MQDTTINLRTFKVKYSIYLSFAIMANHLYFLAHLLHVCTNKWLQRIHGNHPRCDCGSEVLPKERSEWNVFPFLYVTGTPVVHQDHAKDMFVGLLHWDGFSQAVPRPSEKSHFQLEIQKLTWSVHRRCRCEKSL